MGDTAASSVSRFFERLGRWNFWKERLYEVVSNLVKFACIVDRLHNLLWIYGCPFKLVSSIAGKEMHMQVRNRISMYFVIDLYRARYVGKTL